MRFAEGMGNTRENVRNTVLMKETKELVDIFNQLSRSKKYHVGLAALYCYESMQPEISKTKKEGLQKVYGINDSNTLKYFTEHMHEDEWHREVIRNLLVDLCKTQDKQDTCTQVGYSCECIHNNICHCSSLRNMASIR